MADELKKDKMLKKVNHNLWNKFVGYAKIMGKTTTEFFEEVVSPILDKPIGEDKHGKRKIDR